VETTRAAPALPEDLAAVQATLKKLDRPGVDVNRQPRREPAVS
jgi:hypothetical protein